MKTFFKRLLVVLPIFIIGLGFVGYNRFLTPTTVEMKEYFALHRSAFEQKNMGILSALEQKTRIDSGSDAKGVFKWLEIQPEPETNQDDEPIIIRYYTHLRGIGVGAFGTGIAYIDPAGQIETYPNLESMSDDAKKIEGFTGYSHISDNWHSFFWEAD